MKRFFVACCLLGASVGCATAPEPASHSILGVYTVLERSCAGTDTQINACKNITLLEFVKGNFYKVGKDEIAFVIWSGSPAEELLYSAKKYAGNPQLDNLPSSIILASDNNYRETLQFLTINSATYTFGNQGAGISKLKIGRINERQIAKFKKEYPGND
jgi:hypothetical protein